MPPRKPKADPWLALVNASIANILFQDRPPSANNLYPTDPRSGRRFLSSLGKDWKRLAALCIAQAGRPRLAPPYSISIWVGAPALKAGPGSKWSDLSNYIKAIEDALTQNGVIKDDRHVHGLSIQRDMSEALIGRVRVRVVSLAAEQGQKPVI